MVTGPQIINGCQTVRALVEAYREMPPQDQKEFREQTRVQVKIIKTIESDYIGELVITTNDQNPMNPRNLKSNSSEQRDIQKQFRLQLQKKWFYIRKDGEFASLINTNQKTNWFKPHEYSYDKRKYRVIDNEKLAKYWYSFIGFSDETNKGGVAYFKEEENGPYNYIFKKRPTEKFWQEYQNPFFKADDACFEPGTPSIYQYLLAFGVGEYVEKRKISPSKNKQEAIERGLAAKTIKDKTDKKQIDIWLDQDQEYRINHLISNMKDVFLELYGFVFTLKYGRVDTEVSKKIINIGTFQEYLDAGCDHSLVSMNQDGASILGPTYEALKFFIKQYYFENNSEIRVAPRIKMYLSSRNTINKMKVLIIKKNNEISDFMADWKLQGKSFLESLPKI